MNYLKITLILTILLSLSFPSYSFVTQKIDISKSDLNMLDKTGDDNDPQSDAADMIAFFYNQKDGRHNIKIGMAHLQTMHTHQEMFFAEKVNIFLAMDYKSGGTKKLPGLAEKSPILWDKIIHIYPVGKDQLSAYLYSSMEKSIETVNFVYDIDYEFNQISFSIPQSDDFQKATPKNINFYLFTTKNGELKDEIIATNEKYKNSHNCAFVFHGNQGLCWTNVFRGINGEQGNPWDTSNPDDGFDEILDVNDYYNVAGNFHLSGTLITSAEWHDPDFNQKLRDGVADGWTAMLSSAYAQQIMPFVHNNINNKAVQTETELVYYIYNYYPSVAWVPERVWGALGTEPDDNLIDPWTGDNWSALGAMGNTPAVILDDWPHCQGVDNHKIHWMNNGSGIILRVIPIDNDFTGKVHHNAGDAWNKILSTNENSLCVYGTDWEVIANVSGQGVPGALGNYIWLIQQCVSYNIGVWKLDEAIADGNFDGIGLEITPGTYGLIGGIDGYGGYSGQYGNNAWAGHWQEYLSPSDNHSPQWNFWTITDETYNNLMNAPANNISESGWYVLMAMLYETGWHEGLGGEMSGWEIRYSAHIKNANVYAEAAHWANGEYTNTISAYFSDIDLDGTDELIMHNDNIFAVIEEIGGKINWLFAKDEDVGFSVIGSDVCYWSETEGDYNESTNNHLAGLSDVYPNYQHNYYDLQIIQGAGTEVEIIASCNQLTKTIKLIEGESFLRVIYEIEGEECYVKSGFTPDLVDLIWNADTYRVWDPEVKYIGCRNPNTGATGAYILNNGNAIHNAEFEGTLVKGDEIKGYSEFQFLLFAGLTSEPNANGEVQELENLTDIDLDIFPPRLNETSLYLNNQQIKIWFNEQVTEESAENSNNYSFLNFSQVYTVSDLQLLEDNSTVLVTINETFQSGDDGFVQVANIEDYSGNVISPYHNTAVIQIPTGLTPHLILIDGYNDFIVESELMDVDDDSLFLTWDDEKLYIGFSDFDLQNGDFFVNIDTSPESNNGATYGSWGRVNFSPSYLPEYQIAMEGGGGSIQLNYWDGSNWNYLGANGCESYEGWHNNGLTEISIPWARLGNPEGIALSAHLTEENNLITIQSFPPSNPTGNNIAITEFYKIFEPFIPESMPASDVMPSSIPDTPVDDSHHYYQENLKLTNFPNPFNLRTTIKFRIPLLTENQNENVSMKIYNIKGELVKTMIKEGRDKRRKGEGIIIWDGKDENNRLVGSGMYFNVLEYKGKKVVNRMLLLR